MAVSPPFFEDAWLTVHQGDARTVLATLPDESVHCVVTSPPYWGLRDYGEAGQLGLEPTPEAYVAALVDVFREVRRVLRPDGTVWLNLGDSYINRTRIRPSSHQPGLNGIVDETWRSDARRGRVRMAAGGQTGLKEKDLAGIPWRVALALQADGWWLRADVIWHKPNPMTESVTDRPTKSHEYVFLLTRSARYYYDAEAVREPDAGQDHPRHVLDGQASLAPPGQQANTGIRTESGRNGQGRNLRSVWTMQIAPYPGAHFATFPRALPERCIKAGCPENGVVLDPFGGSGTVAIAAESLGRRAVLIELSEDYIRLAIERVAQGRRDGSGAPLDMDLAAPDDSLWAVSA